MNDLELHIESSCQLADEKEVSLHSTLKECTTVVEIVASLRRECLIFILWKLLLEPLDNKLKVQRIMYSIQLNAGEPTVILCICNYLGLGIVLKTLNKLETGIDYGQVIK